MTAHVYILRFGNTADLTRAFDRILASVDVDSCVVDTERERVRFLAPTEPAQQLIEHIYQDGGLVWCTRHRVEALAAAG